VIAEDTKNPNLLFLANDAGVFVSIDRGGHWVKMNNNMPNVPVHDLLVHPREQDLILGTYGRGIYITNIMPLQEMTPAVLEEDVHLFSIKPVVQRVTWQFGANDYLFGQRNLATPNEPNGMVVRYYVKGPVDASARSTVVIKDSAGREVARLQQSVTAGINTTLWTTRAQGAGRGGGGGGGGAAPAGSIVDQFAPLGDYTVTLLVGTKELTAKAQIVKTQGWSLGPAPQVIR